MHTSNKLFSSSHHFRIVSIIPYHSWYFSISLLAVSVLLFYRSHAHSTISIYWRSMLCVFVVYFHFVDRNSQYNERSVFSVQCSSIRLSKRAMNNERNRRKKMSECSRSVTNYKIRFSSLIVLSKLIKFNLFSQKKKRRKKLTLMLGCLNVTRFAYTSIQSRWNWSWLTIMVDLEI